MSALALTASLTTLLLLRQRIIVLLGFTAAFCYLAWGDGKLGYVVLDAWAAADQEILLSIPLFILAGNIMSKGSIATRLIDIMRVLTAGIPGGLAVATVASCAAFAAISGSSIVTMIAVGAIMYPALIKGGYNKRFALGVIAASGTLGIIVPPSIPLILYGVMTDVSIADLFIAGIGPSVILTLLLASYALYQNRHLKSGAFDGAALLVAAKRGVLALLMPALILGGIYSGHFTPTESAAVAVTYAVLVEMFIHRDMDRADLETVALDTARMLGALMPVLMLALSINSFLAFEQIPQTLVAGLSGLVGTEGGFLVMALVLLLVVGCIMDIGAAILILAPLLKPLAVSYGIDPVHFGILMIMNLEIGYLTPPLGLNLIVAMGAFKEDFWTIARATLPFIGLLLFGLVIVTLVPQISLFLIK